VIPFDQQVICSDKINHYRNKVEFTVGHCYNKDEAKIGEICVGFNVGNSSKGVNFVDSPDNILVNSHESLIAA
jgi:tRNA/tmRNA/rRNA uracil-C5-methylase (TrmA/RlmC/RlmD family)